jgi:CMP-N,N'-diacetyllegionaminic acid synthase
MLAIIPARGGSKGVPKKNIRLLAGKPLIIWTIEAAQKSNYIDRIVLSTDSKEIAEICKSTGIDIPFMRPNELALDNSIATDTYIYTIDRLNETNNNDYKEFVVLHPTTPLRLPTDIDNAIKLFFNKNADSVISCVEMSHPPLWCLKLDSNGLIQNYFNFDDSGLNRQDIETAYLPNGAVQVLNYSLIKDKKTYLSEKTFAYIMPQERSVDIDNELDFNFTEFLILGKKDEPRL